MDIRFIHADNFGPESLDSFDRYQEVRNVYRLIDGELVLKANPFTESWSPRRKREKAAEILSGEFITYCAFQDGRVVGEIMLVPELDHGRMIIDSFHVSRECRRQGIGRALFHTAAGEARRKGAHSLYMSACSAEETVDFYFAMGCRLSPEPIRSYAEDEPFDLQLECSLEPQAV